MISDDIEDGYFLMQLKRQAGGLRPADFSFFNVMAGLKVSGHLPIAFSGWRRPSLPFPGAFKGLLDFGIVFSLAGGLHPSLTLTSPTLFFLLLEYILAAVTATGGF